MLGRLLEFCWPPEPGSASSRKNLSDTVSTLREIQSNLQESEKGVFYGRGDEIRILLFILGERSVLTTLLFGPPHCGRTALVKHLQRVWHLAPLQVYSPFLIIDMKDETCHSPNGFAGVLHKALLAWKDIAMVSMRNADGSVAGIPVDTITGAIQELVTGDVSTLDALMQSLVAYTDKLPGVKPVLVLDEARHLKAWEETDPTQLRHFFMILVYLTKQSGRAHCVMTSSLGHPFKIWLNKHLNCFYSAEICELGNFGEADAKGYVVNCLKPKYAGFAEQLNQLWGSLYELCGGCPLTLKQVVRDAEKHKSLAEAIERYRSNFRGDVVALLAEVDGDEKKLLKLLLQSGGVLPLPVVLEAGTDGETIKGLVERDVLHLRRHGDWVQDMGCTRQDEYNLYLMFAKPAMREIMLDSASA